MSINLTSFLVFALLFGGALLGMGLRAILPEPHLSADTKDAVRIGMGMVATMAALLLGLLVASTKDAYDTDKSEVITTASRVVYLEHLLENFGPEAAQARRILRLGVQYAIKQTWPDERVDIPQADPGNPAAIDVPLEIQKLPAQSDPQRWFKSEAAQVASELSQTRWLLVEQRESSISWPMLIIVATWFAVIFASVGLFAPSNATVMVSLLLSALSVAGAIFLILELDQPFSGLIHISSEPMRNALAQLGQ